jgi:hypothetical protein
VRNMRNAYIILFGKPEDERSLGRPRRRWIYILKLILHKLGEGECGVHLYFYGLEQVEGSFEQGNKPSGFMQESTLWNGLGAGRFPKRNLLHGVS